MKAFYVYRNGDKIDTVFWNDKSDGGAPITREEVRRSLIDHDGYPGDIEVSNPRTIRADLKYP